MVVKAVSCVVWCCSCCVFVCLDAAYVRTVLEGTPPGMATANDVSEL